MPWIDDGHATGVGGVTLLHATLQRFREVHFRTGVAAAAPALAAWPLDGPRAAQSSPTAPSSVTVTVAVTRTLFVSSAALPRRLRRRGERGHSWQVREKVVHVILKLALLRLLLLLRTFLGGLGLRLHPALLLVALLRLPSRPLFREGRLPRHPLLLASSRRGRAPRATLGFLGAVALGAGAVAVAVAVAVRALRRLRRLFVFGALLLLCIIVRNVILIVILGYPILLIFTVPLSVQEVQGPLF
mmetsp:Transcript_85860/g.218864  ORF Transcript_85860/g.218864 Transcript_85860/m.218864 type:complete len:244 (+) Transcript_85860:253-984(+)